MTGLKWSWRQKVLDFLKPESALLVLSDDADEILALRHPFSQTSAASPDTGALEKRLAPLGVSVGKIDAQSGRLPFPDASFSLILCRETPYTLSEIRRVLKPGGYFLTQQIGGSDAARARAALGLLPENPAFNLENEWPRFLQNGFTVNFRDQCFLPLRFESTEEFLSYARLPNSNLCKLSALCDAQGGLTVTAHRFILIARRRKETETS